MMNKLTLTTLSYWKDGSNQIGVHPGDASPHTQPFVVRVGNVAFNVLIFAASEEDAIRRLRIGIQTCFDEDYHGRVSDREDAPWVGLTKSKAEELLARIDRQNYWMEPLDTTMVLKVSWASNDRALG